MEKIETRERERRFYIVPELLAPKGTINFINVGDDYYAIVPPETDLTQSEVRRAYLQFVLDPLVLKQRERNLATLRDGIKALLDARRKSNAEHFARYFSRRLALVGRGGRCADKSNLKKHKSRHVQARQKIDRMKTVDEKKAVSAELDAT